MSPFGRPNIDFNRMNMANKTMNDYNLSVRNNKNIDFTLEVDKYNIYKDNRFVRKSPSSKMFNTEAMQSYKTSKFGVYDFQSFRNDKAEIPGGNDVDVYGNYKEKLASIVSNFKSKNRTNNSSANTKQELSSNITNDLQKAVSRSKHDRNALSTHNNASYKKNLLLNKSSHDHGKEEIASSLDRNSIRRRPLSTQNNTSKSKLVNYELTNSSEKSKGIVEAFGICTTNGIFRNYNEDRVSVILNAIKQVENVCDENTNLVENEKIENQIIQNSHCSYFSIFDGHGGNKCANYLRENLHSFIFNDENFPHNIKSSIENGILQAEKEFIDNFKNKNNSDEKNNLFDKSGSCALLALFVKDTCYIANVGDSRAILSMDKGSTKKNITVDHKPESTSEMDRIYKAGGSVYRSKNPSVLGNLIGLSSKFNTATVTISPFKKTYNKFSEDHTSKKCFNYLGPDKFL